MAEFSVDVGYSNHDRLKEGIIEIGWVRVSVDARDEIDACLAAAQMVASTHGMPTRTLIRI